jgi:glycosyltransferase involved in cell wall biosynthesis
MKPTLLITNNHEDFTGGGTYVMMILNILKKYFTIYTDKNSHYYIHPYTPYRFNSDEIQLAAPNQRFDLHLLANYRGWSQPRSDNTAQIIYYPLQKNMSGWNKLLVLNEFCQNIAEQLYPGTSHIITPYYNADDFYVSNKITDLINIGHYFIEPDGHSKNQHLIIEWFKTQKQYNRIIFHGKLSNPSYFQSLLNLAKDDPRIVLKYDRPQSEIRKDLSESKYMIHAIGYGRTLPEQTEHFGLVAVEALLSGCQPIVHNSGGCPQIPGVLTYNEFSDIITTEPSANVLRYHGQKFNIENTENQLKKALNI